MTGGIRGVVGSVGWRDEILFAGPSEHSVRNVLEVSNWFWLRHVRFCSSEKIKYSDNQMKFQY